MASALDRAHAVEKARQAFGPVALPPVVRELAFDMADDIVDFEPPDELVEGLLTQGGLGAMFADPNAAKTFFAIDLSCAVARGVEWMGRRVEQGLVVYLAAESPQSVRTRILA